MKEFIDKLIGRLNKEMPLYASGWRKNMNNIVNQLASEYKDKSVKGDLISLSALMEDVRNTITEQSGSIDWINVIHRQPTYKGYLVGAENAHTDWIPCSERLPEAEEDVLLQFDNGDMCVGSCFLDNYSKEIRWQANDDKDSAMDTDSEPVAWQPLPAPYQPKNCNTCANHTEPDEVDDGCYMCCKGLEDNYQPKGEQA